MGRRAAAAITIAIGAFCAIWPPVAMALKVTLTTTIEGGDRPVVNGKTNLPDGIELMISIARKQSSYLGQQKAQVRGGSFRAGPFSQKGQPLNPGVYNIEVMTPLAPVQPPHTWPTIGNNGAKLEGNLVKKSPYGGRIVEYKTTYKVAGGKTSPEHDKAARAQAQRDRHQWWLDSCKSNCNLTRAVAQRRGERFDWDRCYFKCVADEPSPKQ